MRYYCVRMGGIIVSAWAISACVASALICIPFHKLWTPGVAGTCINFRAYYVGLQIPNVLTDIFIVVIPLREVFGLTMTRTQKHILVGIFGIAALYELICLFWTCTDKHCRTVVFDIIRLVAVVELNRSSEDITSESKSMATSRGARPKA